MIEKYCIIYNTVITLKGIKVDQNRTAWRQHSDRTYARTKMDSEDEMLGIALLLSLDKKKKKKRRYWVNPLNTRRLKDSQFYLLRAKLRAHPEEFFNYYRMSIESFDELHNGIRVMIKKKDTCMRLCLDTEEKLAITLRFLATGCNFEELHFDFLISSRTVSALVKETCEAIWIVFQPLEMKPPSSKERWIEIAELFEAKTNFPNCLGAVDGKHIRLICPQLSGSAFFNYKCYFSIVLMAVVDADYRFIAIDVGAYGRDSDSNIFNCWTFGKKLREDGLNLPEPKSLPGSTGPALPYVFLGDEAFPLKPNFLKPYPRCNLNNQRRIFNYRLSRARRMVECTFGILSNKWRIFHTSMTIPPDFAILVTKTACVLHNFVRRRDGYEFTDTLTHYFEDLPFNTPQRSTTQGRTVRDNFSEYFMSPVGELSYQYNERIINSQ